MEEARQPKQVELSDVVLSNLVSEELDLETVLGIVAKLREDYSDSQRHYHTFKHISAVTGYLEANLTKLNNPRVALWAALYHDEVYDTRAPASQNEEMSAFHAGEDLAGKLPEAEVQSVQRYIKATANHAADIDDPDLLLFLDADMSILGAPLDIYDQYARNIRQEYAWVPDVHYVAARAGILQGFQSRDRIFLTDLAYDEFEQQARKNLTLELESLVD